MTAQFAERLMYEGQEVPMLTTPLSDYLALGGKNPGFVANCTALWRGYVGSWEVVGSRLYLIGIKGTLESGGDATLASIFPNVTDRVFAHWYSGAVRIPGGKILQYVHMGYGSTYERDLFLDIERGVVVNTRVIENGIA
jgi:hypothetical protein